MKYIIGIDEVGRGPLAGPVTVTAVLVTAANFQKVKRFSKGFKDSKKLSPEGRQQWLSKIKLLRNQNLLAFATSSISNSMIDTRGIVPAVRLAVCRSLSKLGIQPEECKVLLDGAL
jgi:ribonuclease HII